MRAAALALVIACACLTAGCRNSCSNLTAASALKWDIVATSAEQVAAMTDAATNALNTQAAAAALAAGAPTPATTASPLHDAAEQARTAATAVRSSDWATVQTFLDTPAPQGLELEWNEAVGLSRQAATACAE